MERLVSSKRILVLYESMYREGAPGNKKCEEGVEALMVMNLNRMEFMLNSRGFLAVGRLCIVKKLPGEIRYTCLKSEFSQYSFKSHPNTWRKNVVKVPTS